jgi:hypothetical protein
MIRILFVFVILSATLLTGCRKDSDPPVPPELRIHNTTPWTLYNCTVDPFSALSSNPGPNAYNFGNIGVNAKTNYRPFSWLHRYAWVRLTMNNKTYYFNPYDYAGEQVFESGRYCYKLSYDPSADHLILDFVEE